VALTTEVSGNLLLIKDPNETLVTTLPNGSHTIDWVAAYNTFRTVFGDDYDFVGFFIDVASGMPNDLGAASYPVFNDITGIGVNPFDNRASYSSAKLRGISWYGQATLSGVVLVQMTELLHELGHYWLAYVNYKDSSGTTQTLLHQDWVWSPGQQNAHWGRWPDKANSSMGYDEAQWIDNGNGTWDRYQRDDTQAVDDAWFGYWSLEQYLMGLVPASATPSNIIQNPNPTVPSVWPPVHSTTGPYTPTPNAAQITVAMVQAEEGVRNPDYMSSQRVFHQGFVIITKSTAAASSNPFVATCEGWRAAHALNFRSKVSGQAMLDTSLLRGNYSDLYVKDNDADTGTGLSSGVFWLSPDLWVRNSQDGGTTNQETIRGQDNFIYVRIRNKGAQPYDNVSVNVYLANFDNRALPGTQFLYPPDWNPAGLIGNISVGTVPTATAGGDGTVVVNVRWPTSQIPPATGWHPCLLCEVIPMETTPSGLQQVWQNKKLAQRNITII